MPIQFRMAQLFGGAIEAMINSIYVDCSAFRQVPDDQEVFLDNESNNSVTIDLCQRVDDADGEDDVFRFHAENILDNEGGVRLANIRQVTMSKFPASTPARLAYIGSMPERKNNLYHGILLLVIRLVSVETDIVVSINLPDMNETTEPLVENGSNGSRYEEGMEMMQRIIETLDVKDYGLFAS